MTPGRTVLWDFLATLRRAARSGDWLTRRRILTYSGIVFGLELVAFLFLIAGTHGWVVPLDKPNTTDFISFYAAGDLANAGIPEAAYSQPDHFAAEQRASEPGIPYVFFFYPPVFLLLCAPFARLPYLAAFLLFEGASLVSFLFAIKAILAEKGWAWLMPMLAFPAIFINLGVGQNAFLTAALFGGATLLVDRRPVVAGVLFGALCYKPHFGLLIPVALLAAGRWRSIAGAAVSVTALITLSAALFGWRTWQEFLTAIAGAHSTYETGHVDFAAFVSPFGALRLIGCNPATAYIVQGAASLVAAALVARVWRRGLGLPIRAATLAAATLVAVPLTLFYDLMLAGVAVAWLIRAARQTRFLSREKSIFVGLFIVPILTRGVGMAVHIPLATLAAVTLLGVCAVRAHREVGEMALGQILPRTIVEPLPVNGVDSASKVLML